MTSATGRTRRQPRRAASKSSRGGFTLIEVVLALTLVLLMAGIVVISLPALEAGHRFDAGVSRFATALRMLRAEAVTRGRRMRLSFDDQGDSSVSWEADPLQSPGVFEPFTAGTWIASLPNDLVEVTDCRIDRLTRAQVMAVIAGQDAVADQTTSGPSSVTFYPDGSTDPAVITLASRNADDLRQATVTLDATTGQVHILINTIQEP